MIYKFGGSERKKTKTGDRKSEKMKTNSPPFIHEELMEEILLKLLTKSVLRFKCLSKKWFSRISDPQFARRHFDAAVAPTYKLLNLVKGSDEAYCVDIESALCADSWHAVSNFSVPSSLSVAGSCRGFLLLQIYFQNFVVWNPSTGIQKQILRNTCVQYDLCGMGYDPVDDDIVVVTVTLKGGRHGQFWNGALYWIVASANRLRSVVIAFDVREKRLLEILLPDHLAIIQMESDIYHLKWPTLSSNE
ncbi:putative F-box protein At3g16210 [Vigna unguiculata]|uniref:putative F-box protein At3g16210 n=1 Tax=Vigna unguiculata TaxID=3917 RepID=UPI001016DCA4|nr:putative F-box protein At3g16210 [Vigna unguiculata]